MAKQKITDKIQAKFEKPQFQPGDAVFFSWLGQKQYGYVTKIKKTNWGIQYTVESDKKRRYPCGLQIDNVRSYDVGFIFLAESKQLGSEECANRINQPRTFTTVSSDTRGTEDESGIVDSTSKSNVNTISREVSNTTTGEYSRQNDVSISNNAVPRNDRKKSKPVKNAELDNAIQRQRDFLSGFIKK